MTWPNPDATPEEISAFLLSEREGTAFDNYVKHRCLNRDHEDVHPSAVYYPLSGRVYCAVCGYNVSARAALARGGADQRGVVPDVRTREASGFGSVAATPQLVEELSRAAFTNKEGLAYTTSRRLAPPTLRRFLVGYDAQRKALSLPCYYLGRLRDIQYRATEAETTDSDKYWFSLKPDLGLFGYDEAAKAPSDWVVVTEGRIDCLSAYELLPTGAAVAVQSKGAYNTVKEYFLDKFDRWDRIYLCYDNEVRTRREMLKLASLLGTHRCYEVKLPPKCKDLNDVLCSYPLEEARGVYSRVLAEALPLAPPLVKSLSEAIPEAVRYLVEGEHHGLSYGVPEIDQMTGGMHPGELLVLSGWAGSGKTTLALAIARFMAQEHGVGVLVGSFENVFSRDTLPKLLSLYEHRNVELETPTKAEEQALLARFGQLDPHARVSFFNRTGSVPLGDLEWAIRRYHARGVRFVLLDHLHYFVDKTKEDGERMEIVRAMKMLVKLKTELEGLMICLLCQPNKKSTQYERHCSLCGDKHSKLYLQDLKGAGDIYEDADTILLINRSCTGSVLETAKLRSDATKATVGERVGLSYDKATATYSWSEAKDEPATPHKKGEEIEEF